MFETIAELQARLRAREISAVELLRECLQRIDELDQRGPAIRSIIEINPEAEEIARVCDDTPSDRRSSLHGIPILLKDNIESADQMGTTAGSLALVGSRPMRDAFVANRLRAAGAVLIGKANMSEWANFRSEHSSSGWSARGGQALNPYVLDRSPCGSSSGSATAVAAGLVPASLGSETSGSILCPASFNGVVGIKPTVGLTSRAGVIPISHTQDTIGPFARTVADAALVLGAIAGPDPRDPATTAARDVVLPDYAGPLDPNALRGSRIGVARDYFGYSEVADRTVEAALDLMRQAGAEIVDPVVIPSMERLRESDPMLEILLYEFKADLNEYLATRPDAQVRTLTDIIRFNREHAAEEMPYFAQELFERAEAKGALTDHPYLDAVATARRLSRDEGIDAVMDAQRLDALIAPTSAPAFKIDHEHGDASEGGCADLPALAGYPAISVLAGFAGPLPIGLTFMGRAFSEPMLLGLAHAFETLGPRFQPPAYLPTT